MENAAPGTQNIAPAIQTAAPGMQNIAPAMQKYAVAPVRIVSLLYGPTALHKAALCKPCVKYLIGMYSIRYNIVGRPWISFGHSAGILASS